MAHGVLKLNADGTYEYQSDRGFVGSDGFEYEVTDGVHTELRVAWISVFASNELLTAKRLHDIGLAMHNFHDVYQSFPYNPDRDFADQYDDQGMPLLSWRVHMLPFLGHADLYIKFRLDEPWDSPHNLPLADQMPDAFRITGEDRHTSLTRFQMFLNSDPDSPFVGSYENGRFEIGPIRDFVDGTGNTVLVGVAGRDNAVPWSAPHDIQVTAEDPFAGLDPNEENIHLLMVDGSVNTLQRQGLTNEEFIAVLTNAGGEVMDPKTLQRRSIHQTLGPLPLSIDTKEQTAWKLQQIGVGFHNYHDVHYEFPTGYHPNYADANGNRFLSWRVHLLPYLGMRPLYSQFLLDEPWDSPHNLTLLDQMPDIFRSEGDHWESTTTRFQVFTGADAPFGRRDYQGYQIAPKFRDYRDGSSNTILVAETGPDIAVPWTAPKKFHSTKLSHTMSSETCHPASSQLFLQTVPLAI